MADLKSSENRFPNRVILTGGKYTVRAGNESQGSPAGVFDGMDCPGRNFHSECAAARDRFHPDVLLSRLLPGELKFVRVDENEQFPAVCMNMIAADSPGFDGAGVHVPDLSEKVQAGGIYTVHHTPLVAEVF